MIKSYIVFAESNLLHGLPFSRNKSVALVKPKRVLLGEE